MLRMYRTAMIVLCLAAIVGVFASNAAAESVCYDFSRVTSGQNLFGQDDWGKYTANELIMVGSGDTGFSGNYAVCTSTSGANYIRKNNTGWGYSLQNDLDWEYSAIVKAYTSTTPQVKIGLNKDDGNYSLCLYTYNGQFRWRLNDESGAALWYPKMAVPTSGAIYQVGVEVMANGGGSYTFKGFYDDLTTSGATREYYDGSDGEFAASYTTTIADLSSKWNGLYISLSGTSTYTPHLDDICISQVPEPSTLALLVAGLVGLLAYAWRKRK